mmetsp:Transcript_18400/g.52752  ORF Transcript_18400/g.52752 Transcript_18400/m.52752 type:complete len:229 (-) Transcript_18400:1353-2039(-)
MGEITVGVARALGTDGGGGSRRRWFDARRRRGEQVLRRGRGTHRSFVLAELTLEVGEQRPLLIVGVHHGIIVGRIQRRREVHARRCTGQQATGIAAHLIVVLVLVVCREAKVGRVRRGGGRAGHATAVAALVGRVVRHQLAVGEARHLMLTLLGAIEVGILRGGRRSADTVAIAVGALLHLELLELLMIELLLGLSVDGGKRTDDKLVGVKLLVGGTAVILLVQVDGS